VITIKQATLKLNESCRKFAAQNKIFVFVSHQARWSLLRHNTELLGVISATFCSRLKVP